ncbi:MAG TPA: hypothetical protein VMT88_04705 [Actinomycetes bacterium]|nr:hypothetical protein [Actinomycetes bacterium]
MKGWGPAGLWLVFTVVAVASGLAAVALVGRAVSESTGPVLSAAAVTEQLHAQTSGVTGSSGPTGEPSNNGGDHSSPDPEHTGSSHSTDSVTAQPTSSPTPTATANHTGKPGHSSKPAKTDPTRTRAVSSRGGTAIAECQGDQAYLRSWSPSSGFRVDEVTRGPAREVEIRFVSSSLEVRLEVHCTGGLPIGSQEVRENDGGGDDGTEAQRDPD